MLGVKDVDLLILEELDDKDLLNFCLTSRQGKKLCNNEDFWRKRFIQRFGYHEKSRSWKDFYLALVYYLDKYTLNKAMREASKGGMKNMDLIKYFISQGARAWNEGMNSAARGGHRDLVDFFISQGANNWDAGMEFAARGGHQKLVNFFINKGANKWNWGLMGAAQGGHRDLVDFFIQKGADHWTRGMLYAERGGHPDLVEFFKQKMNN